MFNRLFGKIKGLPQGVKASGALFFASLITKGISYITTPIFTRILSAEEYGQVSVFLTWQNVFGIIAMFCLMNGVFNNGMVDYPEERDSYSFSILMMSNLITAVFSIFFFLFSSFISSSLNIKKYQMVLMCLVFFFQPAYSFWAARQRYELKYKATVIWSILIAFLAPAVAIVCVLCFPDYRLEARLIGAEGTLIFIYIAFYFYLGLRNRFKIDTRFWKTAFLFNLPLIPHYLSSLLLNSSNRLMISSLVNDTATAYYSVAASVAAVVLIVWDAVNSSLIPYTYEKCKIKDYKSISTITISILAVFAVACVMLVMVAPELVRIMATEDYLEAIYVIPPLVGGVFFQVLYYVFSNIVYYHKKPIYVMIASVTATILNLVLSSILIKRYGYIAAGYSTIFCYMVQATIDYFAMRKVVGEKVYNMNHIIVLSLGVIAISLLSIFLYKTLLIRYAIIFIVLILIICFRKKILQMYKTLKNE